MNIISEYKANTKIHRRRLIDSLNLFQKEKVNSLTRSLKKSDINTMNQSWRGSRRGLKKEEGHRNCEKINKFDTGTCVSHRKRKARVVKDYYQALYSIQKEVMQINYTPLQSHNHLNLHFCFSMKAVRYLVLVHLSPIGLLPQPADKGCPQCKGSLWFSEVKGVQIPSYLGL